MTFSRRFFFLLTCHKAEAIDLNILFFSRDYILHCYRGVSIAIVYIVEADFEI